MDPEELEAATFFVAGEQVFTLEKSPRVLYLCLTQFLF
jgi:hypothetical protein